MKLSKELEKKFVLPNQFAIHLLEFLKNTFPSDSTFPSAYIHSLYYDSHQYEFLYEKINSDYHKRKVRLRWYQTELETKPTSAFLEVKEKFGEHRNKFRKKIDFSAPKNCNELNILDPYFSTLPILLKPHFPLLNSSISPVFLIKYTRHRFILPKSNTRICLDFNIHVPVCNHFHFSNIGVNKIIPEAVFELKGELFELPRELQFLYNQGIFKSSFSKYIRCFETLKNQNL